MREKGSERERRAGAPGEHPRRLHAGPSLTLPGGALPSASLSLSLSRLSPLSLSRVSLPLPAFLTLVSLWTLTLRGHCHFPTLPLYLSPSIALTLPFSIPLCYHLSFHPCPYTIYTPEPSNHACFNLPPPGPFSRQYWCRRFPLLLLELYDLLTTDPSAAALRSEPVFRPFLPY